MGDLFENVAFSPADILLPKGVDMNQWAVVACDQFTSEPEYWEDAKKIAGRTPSALNLILPEVYLGEKDVDDRISKINKTMTDYLEGDVFSTEEDSFVYVERTQSDGSTRCGIVGKIDLDAYEFKPGNNALVRATEGTVLSRIPPRVKVRENAPIELPHVMLLIDDPEKTVIEPLAEEKMLMSKLYDFSLMKEGGRIKGFSVNSAQKKKIAAALESLKSQDTIDKKYGIAGAAPLLFAVGDGNHSLATAKQCYENMKKVTSREEWTDLPSRYALVEVVNIHEEALKFEPIHRTLFDVDPDEVITEFLKFYPDSMDVKEVTAKDLIANPERYPHVLRSGKTFGEKSHYITYCFEDVTGTLVVPEPERQLAVGTLQEFLDKYLEGRNTKIDYIHGDDTCESLGRKPGNISFLLPALGKEQLFKTVMADGVLPRKTFSMGHAVDKRYYIEARKIK